MYQDSLLKKYSYYPGFTVPTWTLNDLKKTALTFTDTNFIDTKGTHYKKGDSF